MPLLAHFLAVLCQMTPSVHLPRSVSTVAGRLYSFYAPLLYRILNDKIQKSPCYIGALAAVTIALLWILFTVNCKPFSISCDLPILYPALYEFSYSTVHTLTVLYEK